MIKKENGEWGSSGFSQHTYINMVTYSDMSVAVLDNLLCVVAREGSYEDGGIKSCVLLPNGEWKESWPGTSSKGAPAIVAFSGIFHLFYVDPKGNAIFRTTSRDGFKWEEPKVNTGHDCASGVVAAAPFGENIILF